MTEEQTRDYLVSQVTSAAGSVAHACGPGEGDEAVRKLIASACWLAGFVEAREYRATDSPKRRKRKAKR